MSRTSPYNPQPFRLLLQKRRISLPQAADLLSVQKHHLIACAAGRVRPNDAVREKLPIFLDAPLAELFTPDRLDRPHRTRSVWRVAS